MDNEQFLRLMCVLESIDVKLENIYGELAGISNDTDFIDRRVEETNKIIKDIATTVK